MDQWISRIIGPSVTALAAVMIVALAFLSLPSAWGSDGVGNDSERDWNFRVYLDDKPIGHHNFSISQNGEHTTLRSEADFEYKLLFVKLYDYEHENQETWQGDCLTSISSQTDANGDPFHVKGELRNGVFRVSSSDGDAELPACVMSFAYWDAEMLQQTRLLNTQNGEYVDVEVSSPVREEMTVRGTTRTALRYRLTAGPLKIDLWYSPDHEWLGLATEARGGRMLRYELI